MYAECQASLVVILTNGTEQIETRPQRVFGMMFGRMRHAKQRHEPVTDELVDHSAVADDYRNHEIETTVHDFAYPLRVESLRHRSEPGDVDKHHRYKLAFRLLTGSARRSFQPATQLRKSSANGRKRQLHCRVAQHRALALERCDGPLERIAVRVHISDPPFDKPVVDGPVTQYTNTTSAVPRLLVAAGLAIRTLHPRAFGVKIERVLADLEPALAGDSGLALLDLGIEEFLDAAALQAHQVIVVAALIELKHRLARFEVMPYQQARLLELRQHAIHRRQSHVQTFRQQLLVDVLGSQVPDLALLEQVDDLEPRQRRL